MRQQSPVPFVKATAAVAAGLGVAAMIVLLVGGGPDGRHAGGDHAGESRVAGGDDGAAINSMGAHAHDAQLGVKKLAAPLRPTPEFVENGIAWILKAQHPDGGWGAGSHADQANRDPHGVRIDPATTAFAASALLRAGPDGRYGEAVRRATECLVIMVESYTKPGPLITDLEGTQIQAKLGPLVDTVMTAHYLARVLPTAPVSDPLRERIDRALDVCVAKLQESQQADGSWNTDGGWAPVLQSSLAYSALEFAQAAGKPIDQKRLEAARKYVAGNYDAETRETNTEAAAGVELYAFGGALRANAAQAKAAEDLIEEAKQQGKLAADAPINEENLKIAGAQPRDVWELMTARRKVTDQNRTINGAAPPSSVAALEVPIPQGGLGGFGGLGGGSGGGGLGGGGGLFGGGVAGGGIAGGGGAITVDLKDSPAAAEPSAADADDKTAGEKSPDETSPSAESASTEEEALLSGFGNNGGEEFLTYMLTAETTVILGDQEWSNWFDKMSRRLSKVQNPDGSWSGHHCITSPVFCTAAVVQTMTAGHDEPLLARLARDAAILAKADHKLDALQRYGNMSGVGGMGGGIGGGGGMGGGMGAAY